jgi:hypothetical protein
VIFGRTDQSALREFRIALKIKFFDAFLQFFDSPFFVRRRLAPGFAASREIARSRSDTTIGLLRYQ